MSNYQKIKATANGAYKRYLRQELDFEHALMAQNNAIIELQCQILEIELDKRKEKNE